MMLKATCRHCCESDLKAKEADVDMNSTAFYCPTCDDEIEFSDCDLEVVKPMKKTIYGYL